MTPVRNFDSTEFENVYLAAWEEFLDAWAGLDFTDDVYSQFLRKIEGSAYTEILIAFYRDEPVDDLVKDFIERS